MKKIFILLGLAAISSAVAVGVSTKVSFKQARADTTEANHYMLFEDNFDSSAYSTYGVVDNIDATAWSGRFNALDRFFRGEGYDRVAAHRVFQEVCFLHWCRPHCSQPFRHHRCDRSDL